MPILRGSPRIDSTKAKEQSKVQDSKRETRSSKSPAVCELDINIMRLFTPNVKFYSVLFATKTLSHKNYKKIRIKY